MGFRVSTTGALPEELKSAQPSLDVAGFFFLS